ncbi:MAG: hypothetical protein NXI24_15920 [bacterium]|nr:hypothetical protein [bacterium]
MKTNLQFIARTVMILGLCASFGACDFDARRRVPPEGLLGFVAQITSGTTIVVGQYCGQTASFTGSAGGYATIFTLCQAACASTTAHLCTSEELQLGAQRGILPPSRSWFGKFALDSDSGMGFTNHDCQGWETNNALGTGPIILFTPSVFPNRDNCNNSNPFACCDYTVFTP